MSLNIRFFLILSFVLIAASCGYERYGRTDNIFTALDKDGCDRAKELFLEKAGVMNETGKGFNYLKFLAYLYQQNKCDEVIIELSPEALSFSEDEQKSSIHLFRARAWKRKMAYDKASADYAKAVELNPKGAALANTAWFLATCPDPRYRNGDRAVRYAKMVMEQADQEDSKIDKSNVFSTLAAAQAEAGDFDQAVKAQEEALALLKENHEERQKMFEKNLTASKNSGSKEMVKAREEALALFQEVAKEKEMIYEERIASYRAGKPWREDPSEIGNE